MPNKYVNKVVIGKETKLDLTADTVTPDKLAKVSRRTTSPAPPLPVPARKTRIPAMPPQLWRRF